MKFFGYLLFPFFICWLICKIIWLILAAIFWAGVIGTALVFLWILGKLVG